MHIAIGGIRHETNTFSPLRTDWDKFHVARGAEILRDPFWSTGHSPDVAWVPTLSAGASPDGLVERATYERLKEDLLQRLSAALPVDGIYLDLHGAMEVEGIGDGESDLITAIRARVGGKMLIAASLDLHANVTPALVDGVNILTAFRTAPHRDETETRRRALEHLVRCVRTGITPVAVLIKPPVLLPGEFAVTDVEPAHSLYDLLTEIDAMPGILDSSLCIGCAWTDTPVTSASVIVVGERDEAVARQQATHLATAVWDRRADFGPETSPLAIDAAITMALALPTPAVFLSDSGDNVTAGGTGDLPRMAERLLGAQVPDAVVAGLADKPAVAACAQAGVGGQVTTNVGCTLEQRDGPPLRVTGVVVHLDPPEQPSLAVLRVGGVDLVLTADRRSFTTRASFARAGIDPRTRKLIVVKQGYLFPELREVASSALLVLTPGCTDLRLASLSFARLTRPIFPLDPITTWRP